MTARRLPVAIAGRTQDNAMGPLGPRDQMKTAPPGARRRRESSCDLNRRASWVSPLRIFVIAVLCQSIQAQRTRVARAIDNPGGVTLDVFLLAFRRLRCRRAAGTTLHVGYPLYGGAEQFFLIDAMRAPIGAVKLGV